MKKYLFFEAVDALIADGLVTIERECFGNAFLALTDRGVAKIRGNPA